MPGGRLSTVARRLDTHSRRDKSTPKLAGHHCLVWTGCLNRAGYGVISVKGPPGAVSALAHRMTWILEHGPLSRDVAICHRCDNRRCRELSHLFAGTLADNNQDMYEKNRYAVGAMLPQTKLTEDQVRAIRKDTRTQVVIAKDYPVSDRTIGEIKRGEIWKHLL